MHEFTYIYLLVFMVVEVLIIGIWFETVWHKRNGIFSLIAKTIPFALGILFVYAVSITVNAICILNIIIAPGICVCLYIYKYSFA